MCTGGGRAILVSDNAQYCRQKAAECWRAAQRTRDPQRKREFAELAQAWLRLADRAAHQPDWEVRFVGSKKTDGK
jgi:hypothetical protein